MQWLAARKDLSVKVVEEPSPRSPEQKTADSFATYRTNVLLLVILLNGACCDGCHDLTLRSGHRFGTHALLAVSLTRPSSSPAPSCAGRVRRSLTWCSSTSSSHKKSADRRKHLTVRPQRSSRADASQTRPSCSGASRDCQRSASSALCVSGASIASDRADALSSAQTRRALSRLRPLVTLFPVLLSSMPRSSIAGHLTHFPFFGIVVPRFALV